MYNKTTLDNGLRVISYNIPTAKSFAIGVFANVGSRDDFENCEGIAHFLEHSVFRRTKNKTSKRISTEFENLGAYTNAFTTKEITCFYVRALSENYDKILKLLYEITINPVFVDKDINKERKIINEEIKSYYDDPEELILDYADDIIFKNSSLSHPIIGTEDSINNIDKDKLEEFHNAKYFPENLVISFIGNIEHKKIVDSINKVFKFHILDDKVNNRKLSLYTPETKIYDMEFSQNHFMYCTRAIKYASDDRYALSALSFLLGEGNSSRLNLSLRENHGMVYTVYSNLQFYSDTGVFSIYAGSERKNIAKIQSIIESEMLKLRTNKITEKDLFLAKQQLKTSAIIATENFTELMQDLAKVELMNQKILTNDEIYQKIDSISINQINELIEIYLNIEIWSKIIFKIK